MSYDDGIPDDIGGLDEQGLGLRRRSLLTPRNQFQGVGTADFPEAPPISRAPQTTASATNEPPPVTQSRDDEKESTRRGRFDLYPPVKPPARTVEGPLAPDISGRSIPEAPPITTGQPARPEGPAATAYESLGAKGPAWEREGKGGRLLDILGMATGVGRNIERASGLGSLGYQSRLGAARTAAQEERNQEFEQARTEEQKARAENERAKANAPAKRQYENINQVHADAVQDAIARGVDPGKDPKVSQIEDAIQRIQKEPAQRPAFTNPFEAFTFGTPEQKQSAQDFLQFEKRMDRQNQKPTEAEFRYSLYLRDPETYKAMYGDKGQAADERSRVADRAHATRMLNFFQHQRDQISKDFMLGDDEKAQRFREIDGLEEPFMRIAREGGGRDTDRVDVIRPDGTPGTVPRSQLERARKKGYKEAARQ